MKIFGYIGCVVLLSFFLFPVSLFFLPPSMNTKMLMGLVGGIFWAYKNIQEREFAISLGLLGAIGLAIVFSLVCYISTDINHTADYAYVGYVGSFFAWLTGAYGACSVIRWLHGECSFRLLVFYLVAVCFAQCVMAMLIDNIVTVKLLVDSYVNQGQEFFTDKGRLYGIGAALDTAGVRFSIVLVMLMALLSHNPRVRQSTSSIVLLLLAFFTIAVIGNAIARTTIIGVAVGIAYFVVFSGLFNVRIRPDAIRLGTWFSILLVLTIGIASYLYQTNAQFYEHMRFAFEGFFNWVEQGEWRTDSTDKLNGEMWIWPQDQQTWLIGSGIFGSFVYSTDIGYCRFILYCGLIGFSIFALFFVYNGIFFMRRSPQYAFMFLAFIAMTFVIWVKVATDIFFIYALLFCLDRFYEKGNWQLVLAERSGL